MKEKYYKFLIILTVVAFFLVPWQVLTVFILIFALFFFTHLKKNNLKLENFEINSTNKDKLTPMSWYRDVIISQMTILRWRLVEDSDEIKVWVPRGQSRVMENTFTLNYSPLVITISGSRNMITMMKSFLDIEKIYL